MWGRREGLNGLTIQAELDTKDEGGSLEDERVKAEDMWGASGVYKAFRWRGVFSGRAGAHGEAPKLERFSSGEGCV